MSCHPSDLGRELSLCLVYPYPPVHHLVAFSFIHYCSIAVQLVKPSLYLVMAPKNKSSNVDNSDMPKERHKMLPLNEKVKVFYLRKEKESVC